MNIASRCSELLLAKYIMSLKYTGLFFKERVVALRRFRAPMAHKKGGCWLQVAGGCSSQVQINVKCLGGSPGWLLLASGCSRRLDCI